MLQELMAALRDTLKKAFPGAGIYEEYVKQGFKRPCFFLRIDKVQARQEVGERYFFRVAWDISYYPKQPQGGDLHTIYRELNEIALQLYGELVLPGYLLSDMRHEIEDNTLHFSLEHAFYGVVAEKDDHSHKMIEMKIEME